MVGIVFFQVHEGIGLQTKLHFSRFEFKYVLRKDLREEIEKELNYFLQLDPYVESQDTKKYFVRSLYFDDPVLSNYYEKMDGMLHRAKFRLRTYSEDSSKGCPTFLELKGRHNALVFKHRVGLEIGTGRQWGVGQKISVREIVDRANKGDVVTQFKYECARKQLSPIMLIDYQRRPYVSKYDAEFRLTFDDHLSSTKTDCLFPKAYERSRAVLRGYTVMEVKFRYHMPSWFHRVVQSYGLRRVSVSKICEGISAWDMARLSD